MDPASFHLLCVHVHVICMTTHQVVKSTKFHALTAWHVEHSFSFTVRHHTDTLQVSIFYSTYYRPPLNQVFSFLFRSGDTFLVVLLVVESLTSEPSSIDYSL